MKKKRESPPPSLTRIFLLKNPGKDIPEYRKNFRSNKNGGIRRCRPTLNPKLLLGFWLKGAFGLIGRAADVSIFQSGGSRMRNLLSAARYGFC